MKDTLFDQPQPPADFRFDERVAAVFPDMIQRSIPGYATLLELIAAAALDLPAGARVYDLGCATGGAALTVQARLPAGAELIAVDSSAPMVERLRQHIDGYGLAQIHVLQADITTLELQPAALVILNFTLQFIAKAERDTLLTRIYQALEPGGRLLLAEKVAAAALVPWHEDFKRLQGYSALAIAQKRSALENVMKLDDAATVEARLRRAGFGSMQNYFRALQFYAWVATKR